MLFLPLQTTAGYRQFARVLFSQNFASAKFNSNKTLANSCSAKVGYRDKKKSSRHLLDKL